MTEHQPFIDTVLERPEEDGPRLVYADWLEERGECERAEFIRVQIRMAMLTTGFTPADQTGTVMFAPGDIREIRPRDIPEAKTLYRRERELLKKNRFDWEYDLAEVVLLASGRQPPFVLGDKPFNSGCGWRRGFVEELTLSWEDWGGVACRQCSGAGQFQIYLGHGDSRVEDCETCRAAGRIGGHAEAILKQQPIRKVKLTTLPDEYEPGEGLRGERTLIWLKRRWPKIEFAIPPVWRDYAAHFVGDLTREEVVRRVREAMHRTQFMPPEPVDDLYQVQDELSR